jgi:hypothetical protein
MTTNVTDCRFCIDGYMPAGTDPDIGALYEHCPACTPACDGCDGIAVFPASTHCALCFIESLIAKRLGPIFCPRCQGVITLIDLDTEATP